MAGTKAGAKKGYQTYLKKYGLSARKELASRAGKAAQAAHPELQRFRDTKYASEMAKKPRKKIK